MVSSDSDALSNLEAATRAAATAVDGERLWQRLIDLSRHGGFGERGVNRQAFSEEEIAARRLLLDWAEPEGMTARVDDIGNLYIRWTPDGVAADAPAVLTGSHLDSQPLGGRYDGAYGVVAGLEAIIAIKRAGLRPRRPLEVVSWSNEEGSRFQPGVMGSNWLAGKKDLEELRASVDSAGMTCGEALDATLAATPGLGHRSRQEPIAAFIETHIEQGPILEGKGLLAAAVEGVQGIKWFEIEVGGQAAHAGTTPLRKRADAFVIASEVARRCRELAVDEKDETRFTVGRFEVSPGSPNTVPERVLFTIDLRHPDGQRLKDLARGFGEVCAQADKGPCSVRLRETSDVAPTVFDPKVVETVETNLERLGHPRFRMRSGAGHDAMLIAGLAPTAMIFIACREGISHNPTEYAEPAAVTAGAQVLAASLAELALREG